MYIYIFIIITILVLGILLNPNHRKKNKITYLVIVFSLITVVGAIRNVTVGVDTEQFCNAFNIISSSSLKSAFELRYESGFIILCKLLSFIWDNQQILIIATSLFIFPTIGFFIYKNSKDVVLSSLLYILLNTFAMHMNVMRQAISIAIIIIGYECFFKKEKNIKYIITIILASLFHQTALIMLILFAFKNKEYTIKTYIITTVLGVSAFILAGTVWRLAVLLFPTYVGYANTEYIETSYLAGTISAIIAWLVLTMGIFFERKNKSKDKNYHFLAYMMSIIFIVDMLVIKINLFVRLASYFGIFTIIWIPNTLKNNPDKNEKALMAFIVLICFILYWGILSIYRPEWYGVIPYTTFFDK